MPNFISHLLKFRSYHNHYLPGIFIFNTFIRRIQLNYFYLTVISTTLTTAKVSSITKIIGFVFCSHYDSIPCRTSLIPGKVQMNLYTRQHSPNYLFDLRRFSYHHKKKCLFNRPTREYQCQSIPLDIYPETDNNYSSSLIHIDNLFI